MCILFISEKSTPITPGTGEKPPLTQQSKVSFADNIVFERERSRKSFIKWINQPGLE